MNKRLSSTESVNEEQQIDKFRDLARKLECDEDEATFDERLKRLAVRSQAAQGRRITWSPGGVGRPVEPTLFGLGLSG